jgi:glycosyltransferase involved in cell wall biosynthesis
MLMRPRFDGTSLLHRRRQCPRRLLFLLPFAPRLDATDGGGRATAQLLLHLATRHHVTLLYLRTPSEPPVDDLFHKQCELVEEVIRPDISFGLAQRWSRLTSVLRGTPLWASGLAVKAYGERLRALAQRWQPDIVQLEYHVMGQYLTALDACPAPRLLTEHEPGIAAARDLWQATSGLTRWIRYLDLLAWRRFEPAIIRQLQAVVVFTEHDRQAVAQLTSPTRIVRISLGTMLPEHPLNPLGAQSPSLLFVGNFRHPPNVDAAMRLTRQIFPGVRAQYPGVTLQIVGDQPTPEMRRLANEHIVVTGRVPDVTPYLDRAALVVVPLRIGGGMRVKVLEALAAGKALVTSPLAIAGLDLVDGKQVVLAETDQQFCEAIVHLLVDSQQRASLAAHARAWACANLGWEHSIRAYETLYETLLARTSAGKRTQCS